MSSDSSRLTGYLKREFLDEQNYPEWDKLAGALIGGLLTLFGEVVISTALAVGEAVERYIGLLRGGYVSGTESIGDAIATVGDSITLLDVGVASLPVNAAIILGSMYLIARAVEAI